MSGLFFGVFKKEGNYCVSPLRTASTRSIPPLCKEVPSPKCVQRPPPGFSRGSRDVTTERSRARSYSPLSSLARGAVLRSRSLSTATSRVNRVCGRVEDKALENKFVVNLYRNRVGKGANQSRLMKNDAWAKLRGEVNISLPLETLFLGEHARASLQGGTSLSQDCGRYTCKPDDQDCELFNKLRKQLDVQYEMMRQATNALTLCRNNQQMRIHAEKIMLVSSCKYNILKKRISECLYSPKQDKMSASIGTVVIRNFNFPMRYNTQYNNSAPHYIVLASCGSTVKATEVAQARCRSTLNATEEAQANNVFLSFSEQLIFEDLPDDFVIDVGIYTFTQEITGGRMSAFLNACNKARQCVKKAFESERLESSFEFMGCFQITKCNWKKSAKEVVNFLPARASLQGTVTYECETIKLNTPGEYCGFLNYMVWKDMCTGAWDRRWCVFKNGVFSMYNFPSDEDTGRAVKILDMRKYAFCSVEPMQRTICPRPKTLLLEVCEDVDDKHRCVGIQRHLLNSNCVWEMSAWLAVFTDAVQTCQKWGRYPI